MKRPLAAHDLKEIAHLIGARLARELRLGLAAVPGLEFLREVAVGPQHGVAAQVDRAVLAVDPVGELGVVRERADQEDRELARIVDGQQEGIGDVAPILLDV